jgi:hypothetical protein
VAVFSGIRRQALSGGYGVAYDPSLTLEALENGTGSWDELWENLHHQGDVGTASYAAVPHIVRISSKLFRNAWEPYALVATIETERHRRSNPDLPDWLAVGYAQAIREFAGLATSELLHSNDPLLVQSILGFLALAQGQTKLGALICNFDQSEIDEAVEERLAWSTLYS